MSTQPPPPDRDDFDWTAAEHDLAGSPNAEVVDLDAACTRRTAGTTPDPNADDVGALDDTDEDGPTGPVMVDSLDAQRRPRFSLAAFRDATRVPIVPSWQKSGAEFGTNLAWACGFGAHHQF
ncbi:hypothetical protein [Actinoplanes sp. NPDC049681]|uniref:hypothetical protein n=1 Tax=Actinoplanes sp. NPDC049681 TaxID=3363905 RepID=UPI00378A8642